MAKSGRPASWTALGVLAVRDCFLLPPPAKECARENDPLSTDAACRLLPWRPLSLLINGLKTAVFGVCCPAAIFGDAEGVSLSVLPLLVGVFASSSLRGLVLDLLDLLNKLRGLAFPSLPFLLLGDRKVFMTGEDEDIGEPYGDAS